MLGSAFVHAPFIALSLFQFPGSGIEFLKWGFRGSLAMAIACTMIGTIRVAKSWKDDTGGVIRWSSVVVLATQSLAILYGLWVARNGTPLASS